MRHTFRLILATLAAATIQTASLPAQTPILTRSYDNTRCGVNRTEVTLTPDDLARRGLKRMRLPLPGAPAIDDPRIEAQPLYVPALKMKDGKKHNVIFACSMANSIYAFDADTGHIIAPYPISLGPAIPSSNMMLMEDIAYWGINDQWGILSTPVIDLDSQTLYAVNWTTEPDGQRVFRLNAIALATGLPRHPPQAVRAEVGTEPFYSAFDPNMQKQRSALLLSPLRQTGRRPREEGHLHGVQRRAGIGDWPSRLARCL